jgi:hypothetical protein
MQKRGDVGRQMKYLIPAEIPAWTLVTESSSDAHINVFLDATVVMDIAEMQMANAFHILGRFY